MIIKFFLLAILLRTLVTVRKPFLLAGLYTGFLLILSFFTGLAGPFELLFAAAVLMGSASLFFWLLDHFEGTFWFWVVLVIGFPIILVF